MMSALLVKALLLLILLHAIPQTDGKKFLEVRQQEVITVGAGQSVTISCSFVFESASYTVIWTRGCSHKVPLTDQTCYNGRINHYDVGPINITTDSGTKCCERHHTLTITNLTENDSGTYCCHMQTINGDEEDGSGTKLEVTPRTCKSDVPMKIFVLYAVVGAETCIILILVVLVIRCQVRGSSQVEDQMFEEECPSKLHYAEIRQSNQPKRSKARKLPEERVTYAPVKIHH